MIERDAGARRMREAAVDELFVNRWSPRAFAEDSVDPAHLVSLFEAARWAPSCFNEQPWLFLYAADDDDLPRFRALLSPKNRAWAGRAPVLAFLFARLADRDGDPNRWAEFDAGAAWMSLALQAARLGLSTHAMASFTEGDTYPALGVSPDEYRAMAAIAIGHQADPSELPPALREREVPSGRVPLRAIVRRGRMGDDH